MISRLACALHSCATARRMHACDRKQQSVCLQAGDRWHMLRFDVRNDDNWTMRARPEAWDSLSCKLARTALQGGHDKLPRGTKLALSAGDAKM
jgi:hypothetical protein